MNLRDLYQSLSTEEREAFAERVGIKPGYLWQIATQWKGKKPSLDLLKKIADSHPKLTVSGLVGEFTDEEPATRAPEASDKQGAH
jgi:transcriptional regulator with XRE-family HTH domain